MGTLALAAKISHDPVIAASGRDGPLRGSRQAAIDGLALIGKHCVDRGVKALIVLDATWRVHAEYHVNAAAAFSGSIASQELPHLVHGLPAQRLGNAQLAQAIADMAEDHGLATRTHPDGVLNLGWGTLLPLQHLDPQGRFEVVAVAAGCEWHDLHDSARFGRALRQAVEARFDGSVALLASGSLSHRFAPNGRMPEFVHRVWNPMLEGIDHEVVDLWEQGRWKDFCDMLPVISDTCFGEGRMHDTAMLLGALGWDQIVGAAEVVTPLWGSCGTGQVNALFPLGPLPAAWRDAP